MDLKDLEKRTKEYVELEADTKVKNIKYIDKFNFLGDTDIVFLVNTEKGNFWVVGGSSPINLYEKTKFNSADEAFSFHLGLMIRISEKQKSRADDKIKKIDKLIEEGNLFVESSNLKGYDSWKRKIQFFIEKIGSPLMIEEVNKELNKKFFWITTTSSPQGDVGGQIFPQKIEQIKKVLSILEAIKNQLDFDDNENEIGETRDEFGYDVFICHASDDKKTFVKKLAEGLLKRNLKVWYDDFTFKIGDSLRKKIDQGLANSRYGIVVLSRSFFSKEWPQKELDGLTAREIEGKKVILPVWHNINKEEVLKFSPTLAGLYAGNSNKESVQEIVDKLVEAMKE